MEEINEETKDDFEDFATYVLPHSTNRADFYKQVIITTILGASLLGLFGESIYRHIYLAERNNLRVYVSEVTENVNGKIAVISQKLETILKSKQSL